MAEATPELSPNVEITKLPLIQLSAKLPVQGAIASLLENAFPALYPIAPPPESKEKEGAVALSEQLPPINNNVGETSSQVNVSGHEAEQPTLARQKSAKATTKGVAPSSRPGSKGGINSGAQKQEPIPSTIAPDVSTGHADVSAALADPAGQLSSQNGSTAEASVGAEQIGQSSSFKKRSGPNGEKVEKIELDCQVSVQHGAELISYLERQLIQSKEADMAQLLDDDAVFTPNHRKTGLPMKQSQLMIDRGRLAEEGLLDPKEILEREKEMEEQAQMPPRTLEYLDVNAKGYLKTTANLAVRQKITLGRAATLGASLTKR